MKKSLYTLLEENDKSDIYPFHMPGHKRNAAISYIPTGLDITEIDGFDNLHHSLGILKESQERAAHFYGADKTWFLINGSTSGLLIAVSAVFNNNGGSILIARNCHKAVYNAVYLNRLNVEYLFPEDGCICPADVERAIVKNKEIKAVVVTSPTYEGIVSDIGEIAKVCHAGNIPLIVDEAHGAHFVLGDIFPESALKKGADIVINSIHKTLPSMTQTALLHLNGDRVSRHLIDMYSGIYQSSSPSYVMMAGIDGCINYLIENRERLCFEYCKMLKKFEQRIKNLKHIQVYITKSDNSNIYDKDCSKILIYCKNVREKGKNNHCDGRWLHDILLNKYHLQMEMAAADYVIALTSVMDREEGFVRLAEALTDIDNILEFYPAYDDFIADISMQEIDVVFPIYEAVKGAKKKVLFAESAGLVSAEYIYLYPPGSPLIVPGERISGDLIKMVKEYQVRNYDVEGPEDKSLRTISVVTH